MKDKIRLSKSCVGEQEMHALSRVMSTEYLGMGPTVREFEFKISQFVNVDVNQVCCVSSGTAALHLAVNALQLSEGDEVVIPSITYVASFQAVAASGAKPVACDVDPRTGLMTLEHLKGAVSSKTRAVMFVHYASQTQGLRAIRNFCSENGLRLIEDAAHSFGGSFEGRPIGGTGDITCFSFDGIKNITSGEGGCVISADIDLVRSVGDARLLGVMGDSANRYRAKRSWDFDVCQVGFRYHMSDLMAAIGLTQLDRIEEFSAVRRLVEKIYFERLANIRGVEVVRKPDPTEVPHIFPLLVDEDKQGLFRESLDTNGVATGWHYKPNHLLTLFKCDDLKFPHSESFSSREVTIPMHADMTADDANYICDIIIDWSSKTYA